MRAGDKIGFMVKVDHEPEHVTGVIVSMYTVDNDQLRRMVKP